jgi:S-adenosylmethionine-diacylglycerol 3-amino-3-carboxypropyl transferase
MTIKSEIAGKADFGSIRYAQCWEDADVLLEAMQVRPADTFLSIASAGDNTLALVGAGAKRVIAVDLSPAQIACLELRVAAYRRLAYDGFLSLLGQTQCGDRDALFHRCRLDLSAKSRKFWDSHPELIRQGIAQGGKFERYLAAFRRFILPLVQRSRTVRQLFELDSEEQRRELYERSWNNSRWQILCRIFFGRVSLGRFGRDPGFMRYADEPVWNSLQRRIPNALVAQRPRENPYLQWILKGRFESALPYAWREENFAKIRDNLDALEWRCEPIEQVLADLPDDSVNGCNLSDIFEYMSETAYETLLHEFVRVGTRGARLVYWNVVVDRHRPKQLSHALRELRSMAARLHRKDKAFFYRNLIVEEVA